ncbi:MAG: hypothetical protein ABR970_09775 [Roseiarcus sp.]
MVAPPGETANRSHKEKIMRQILVLGATAVAFALGAANAHATAPDLFPEGSRYAISEPQTLALNATNEGGAAPAGEYAGSASAPTMREGRATFIGGDDWRVLGDEGHHHPEDDGYRDPSFSSQQDETYDGRF